MRASACQVSSGVWYNSFCRAGGWVGGCGVCVGGGVVVQGTPGYLRLLSPPLPPHRPRSRGACCRQQPRGGVRREDGVEGGSQAGLTPWPPTAGAEAATRPASLREGGERAAWQQTQGGEKAGGVCGGVLHTVPTTARVY